MKIVNLSNLFIDLKNELASLYLINVLHFIYFVCIYGAHTCHDLCVKSKENFWESVHFVGS